MQFCYIIGKGPSLDQLGVDDFESGHLIFCINDSIHKVCSLGLQNLICCVTQDIGLGTRCQIVGPTYYIIDEISHLYKNHPNVNIVSPTSGYTVNLAIKIAQQSGVNHFKLLCFDACVTGNTDYADCIGYKSTFGGDPKRFLDQRRRIIKYSNSAVLEWIIPKHPASVNVDTLQQ